MKFDDITNAMVGTRQVSAIYLGDTLVWPTGVMTYVITSASLVYSSGSTISADGSNYAYALGTVNVYRGTSLINTMTNVHLGVSVSSQDFYVTRPSGLNYDVIKGYNLGTTATQIKTTAVTASYASDTHTAGNVTQEANVAESYTYNISVDIDVVGNISGSGGIYQVDYVSQRTPTYTSGSVGTAAAYSTSVSTSNNCTASVFSVYGSGYFEIDVDQNPSTSVTRNVVVTLSDGTRTVSDTVVQDVYVAPVVNTASVAPQIDLRTGGVRLRLTMTSGTFPSNPVVISGITYHYVRTGYSTEHTIPILADITINDPRISELVSEIPAWSAGESGTHWFSATSVSEIGLGNTTFPHTEFEVLST